MSVPLAWFIFAWQYTRRDKRITRSNLISLLIIPFVITVLIWTNGWHHLMWSDERLINSGPFLVTAKTYGPFFWVAIIYNYVLIVSGAVLLIRNLLVGTSLYTGQMVSLIIAVSLPLFWNIIYVFNLLPLPRKDLTPAAFAISGMAIVLGLMRFHLLTAVPFARQFIIEQLSDGILIFDSHNRLLEVNPAAMKIIGTKNNIVGRELKNLLLVSPVFRQLFSIQTGRLELLMTVSGESRFYEMETTFMCDKQGIQMGWLVTLRDITESKKLQQHLMAQDRLASIGQFTSDVTHEINNALTPILGFAEMLLLNRDLTEDSKSDLIIIRDSARQAAGVINRLLTFARQSEPGKAPCDIEEIVESAVQFRYYQLEMEGIVITRNFSGGLPKIFANSTQLRQVFLNIIANAEYAISQLNRGGNLKIKTEKSGDIIRVSIKDDGPGITKDNMDKLFTPFFTTKKVGEGTGMGLSICYGIIKEHLGRIFAESIEGEGATFIVELPVLTY